MHHNGGETGNGNELKGTPHFDFLLIFVDIQLIFVDIQLIFVDIQLIFVDIQLIFIDIQLILCSTLILVWRSAANLIQISTGNPTPILFTKLITDH
jgi:hypothetical protein